MDMSARRALFILGSCLFWIGCGGLAYNVAFARDYSPEGLINTMADLGLMFAGSLFQASIYEAVLLFAVAFGIYNLSIQVWSAPVVVVLAGSVMLIANWYNRFDSWRMEHRKAILRDAEMQPSDAMADREANRPEYPGVYDRILGRGPALVKRRRLADADSDPHTFDG